jgi:hypothetical protein
VPLIVVTPDERYAGLVVDEPVGLHAVHGTIKRVLGIEGPTGPVLPLLPGWPLDEDPAVVETLRYDRHNEHALVTRRWLYRNDLAASRESVYDLEADPHASRDLGSDSTALPALRSHFNDLHRDGTKAR